MTKKKAKTALLYCESSGVKVEFTLPSSVTPDLRFYRDAETDNAHYKLELERGTRMTHITSVHADESANIRSVQRDEADFVELVSSIAAQGILQPIVVKRTLKHAPCSYKLVAGFRRYAAAVDLGEVYLPIRVIGEDVDDTTAALIENCCRKDMDPFELAMTVAQIRDKGKRNPKTKKLKNLSHREVAAMTGIGQAKITGLLTIAEGVHKSLIEANRAGDLTYSNLKLLATLPNHKEQAAMLKVATDVSNVELRKLVSKRRKEIGASPKNKKEPADTNTESTANDKVHSSGKLYSLQPIEFLIHDLEEAEKSFAEPFPAQALDHNIVFRVRILQYVLGITDNIDAEIVEPVAKQDTTEKKKPVSVKKKKTKKEATKKQAPAKKKRAPAKKTKKKESEQLTLD